MQTGSNSPVRQEPGRSALTVVSTIGKLVQTTGAGIMVVCLAGRLTGPLLQAVGGTEKSPNAPSLMSLLSYKNANIERST